MDRLIEIKNVKYLDDGFILIQSTNNYTYFASTRMLSTLYNTGEEAIRDSNFNKKGTLIFASKESLNKIEKGYI